QFVVVDVAEPLTEMRFAQEPKVSEQLAESDVRRQGPHLGQDRQRFALCLGVHGSRSPILGSAAYGWGSLPITSTRIKVPGASLAIRVARVTPFYSTNTLSDPSQTHGGGIPSADR